MPVLEEKETKILYRIGELSSFELRIKDKEAKFKLFNNPHAFKAILAFLDATKIGINPNWEERKEENLRELDL
jgi:hypothetical protein